jgi:hypothetical protein
MASILGTYPGTIYHCTLDTLPANTGTGN